MNTLFLIDDDAEVLMVNKKYFINERYDVKTFTSALDAISMLDSLNPVCIVLDIMMPELDGFAALPLIKEKSDAPIIFLTGKASEDDKINGLLSGADDYIVKPYSLKELSARIKVQLRKSTLNKNSNLLEFPPLSINLLTHKVYYNISEEINITNREYELLELLLSKPGKTVTFEEIGMKIWNYYQDSDRQTVMMMTSRLRKKLEKYKGLIDCIVTVYGKGYKFNPSGKDHG